MTAGYALGIDFGTLSGRAVLVEVGTGREVATAVKEYAHGVIDRILPATGERLPPDYALQDPEDYREVLREVVPAVLSRAGATAADVVGVGIDATSCTLLPTKADGTPLCFLPEFRGNRHAYATLWKHHAAQEKARRMTAVAEARGEPFLPRYGGKVSSEWLVPKVW